MIGIPLKTSALSIITGKPLSGDAKGLFGGSVLSWTLHLKAMCKNEGVRQLIFTLPTFAYRYRVLKSQETTSWALQVAMLLEFAFYSSLIKYFLNRKFLILFIVRYHFFRSMPYTHKAVATRGVESPLSRCHSRS